jgi:hypothetical protein
MIYYCGRCDVHWDINASDPDAQEDICYCPKCTEELEKD